MWLVRSLAAVLLVVLGTGVFVSQSPLASASSGSSFSFFTGPSVDYPFEITAGPDGNLWFTNGGDGSGDQGSIGQLTPGGIITTFSGPGVAHPKFITSGPDGNLWFTNSTTPSISRITPGGAVTNFSGPGIAYPGSITSGPDGALWFTDEDSIGRIATSGAVTVYPTYYQGNGLHGIALGSDGALWFGSGNSIGRITTTGVVTQFTGAHIEDVTSITDGPDGALWFTNRINGSIGRITTSGVVTNYTGTGIFYPTGITSGPDGAIWFTDALSPHVSIGRITTSGSVTIFNNPDIANPIGIAAGSDGALWFTNREGLQSIGRVTVPAPTFTTFSPDAGAVGSGVTIKGNALEAATSVTINGIPAPITKDSATTIKVTVPSGATTGKIKVKTASGGATSPTVFTVT
jgi:virginiamycin B lyase